MDGIVRGRGLRRGALVRAAVLAAVAIAAVNIGILVEDTVRNGWIAYDTRAYWLAGRHLLDGQPLYQEALVWTFGAFKYPPVFAQLFAPVALLPPEAVDWLWRLLCFACFRYLAGSWKAAFVATAVWGIFLQELWFGNVTFQLGAACLFALRDRRGSYLLPWFAALKFGPALLMVYLWFVRPEWRGALVRGTAVFLAACAASFAIAPALWVDYLGTFGWEASSRMEATGIITIVASHGLTDFALRLAVAVAATALAIRLRADWLAFAAAVVTCPILTRTRLAPLVGLWPLSRSWRMRAWRRVRAWFRLRRERERSAAGGWAGVTDT